MKSKGTMQRTAVLLLGLLIVTGCAGANYGQLKMNDDITKLYETYRMDPDANYFTSGSDTYPNAIVGLKKAYTMDSDLWKFIAPTPEQFRSLINDMQVRGTERVGRRIVGFAILDPQGKEIGTWYSIFDAVRTVGVIMKPDNRVLIHTPPIDVYDTGGNMWERSDK